MLAAHRDPHDGAAPEAYAERRPRLVRELDALGLEVGLHASYTASRDERLSAGERAELARLLGGPIAGNRHHYLRLPWHEGIRALDRLGVAYDTTLGYAERPGPARRASRSRSGRGTRARAARCASSSCRSC